MSGAGIDAAEIQQQHFRGRRARERLGHIGRAEMTQHAVAKASPGDGAQLPVHRLEPVGPAEIEEEDSRLQTVREKIGFSPSRLSR